jgi:hypothetical protein
MTHVPAALKAEVEQRAGGRCEYCRLSQAGQEARFHVDHILPVKLGGTTAIGNLCLACVSCSLRKGAKTEAVDPESNASVPLFHPRRDEWPGHFYWRGVDLCGLTPVGRATIAILRLNRPLIVEIRREEALRGRHPS